MHVFRALGGLALVAACATGCERPRHPPSPQTTPPGAAQVAPKPALYPAGAVTPAPVCPPGAVLVAGDYCPAVEHRCERWLDPPGPLRRCKRYAQPARCLAPRRHLRFCIDRGEYVPPGARLPENHLDFFAAAGVCAQAGKRLCTESEWNFACEGEQMRPYPYGWERDEQACNADHLDLLDRTGHLADLRAAPGDYPRCATPFGVFDMSGNLEELVARDRHPRLPALKGAHWQPGRNQCRAREISHGPHYAGVETGTRCCADAGAGKLERTPR